MGLPTISTMASSHLLLLLLLILSTTFTHALDTLSQGQSIKDGETLLSSGGAFELGFFSPGNSSSRYVGIWYYNISTQSLVWVANRESPLPASSSSGSLTLTANGSLSILNASGDAVWSTPPSSSSTSVQLLDSGNLVLHAADGSTVQWQSFDYPTDTFLPGMRLLLDRKARKNTLLTSWKAPDDPSPGAYSLGLDPRGSGQIFIWEGSSPRWRSGQWNGQIFTGASMRPLYLYGFKFTNDAAQGVMYFTFTSFNSSQLRFVLQTNGVENTTMLVGEEPEQYWESVWMQPNSDCEVYGKCGAYAVCTDDGATACGCLKGFEPRSVVEWNRGNWTGGCVRRAQLQNCKMNNASGNTGDDEDGFFRMGGLKLPDLSDWASTVATEEGCRTACINNCSCKAYAFPSGIGCLIWGHDLVDIYQFTEGGNDLYIKLAASELGSKRNTWKIIVIVSTLGVFMLIICIFFWWRRKGSMKDCWNKDRKQGSLSRLLFSQEVKIDFSGPSDFGDGGQQEKGSELQIFSFDSLVAATKNFSNANKLGQGGFGHVYKGKLPEGQEIAVKRLSANSGQGLDEFKNEVLLIAKLQHRNLVRLLGCCIKGEEKILIYEYMPNKSLDNFIFETAKQMLLDWEQRFSIIEGIARGLLYLHRDSRLRIIHRDLKTSNILLDEHMNPKISDFGMARIFGGDQNQANTNRVVGTYGYMSPEYAMEGLFSVKSDVYSFGVLILEIVTGRRNSSFHRINSTLNLVGHAWQLWNEDRSMELIDASLQSSGSVHQMLKCIHVALLCVQDNTNDRPDMSSVVHMLGSETATFQMPKQPKFIIVGSPNENENEGDNQHSSSASDVNHVTITVVQGR